MKLSLPIKLTIFVVLLFVAVIAGMVSYRPLWMKYQTKRLLSDDAASSEAGAVALAREGERIIPLVREWLESKDRRKTDGAFHILEKMDDNTAKRILTAGDRMVLTVGPTEVGGIEIALLPSEEKIMLKIRGELIDGEGHIIQDGGLLHEILQRAFRLLRTCPGGHYFSEGMEIRKLELSFSGHERCYVFSGDGKGKKAPQVLAGMIKGLFGQPKW